MISKASIATMASNSVHKILYEDPHEIENRKKETRIRVLNNWLLFTMPNGRNLSNRIKEERWTEPRYDLNFVNSANHSI